MPALAWSPERYGRHAAARLRPALDLLDRVPLGEEAATVVDLGCGAGALFPALRARFPRARLVGVDLSPAMLAKARAAEPDVELALADAGIWRPAEPVDLILANAALHWVPGHDRLLPDLLRHCRVLAVQVPANFAAPSHRLIHALAAEPEWRERLAGLELGDHVLAAASYHAILTGAGAAAVDLWETTYHHALTGPEPVLEWLKGTTLLPVHEALGGADAEAARAFERALGARLAAAYPADPAGVTLFPFKRLFFVATASRP
jgi:trans-aconitate 2-methyltransferase